MKIFAICLCLALAACNEPRSTASAKESQDIKPVSQPLTDNEHVEVYTFIVRYLEEDAKPLSEKAVQIKLKTEQNIQGNRNLKPHIACMFEVEIAGLLRILL